MTPIWLFAGTREALDQHWGARWPYFHEWPWWAFYPAVVVCIVVYALWLIAKELFRR